MFVREPGKVNYGSVGYALAFRLGSSVYQIAELQHRSSSILALGNEQIQGDVRLIPTVRNGENRGQRGSDSSGQGQLTVAVRNVGNQEQGGGSRDQLTPANGQNQGTSGHFSGEFGPTEQNVGNRGLMNHSNGQIVPIRNGEHRGPVQVPRNGRARKRTNPNRPPTGQPKSNRLQGILNKFQIYENCNKFYRFSRTSTTYHRNC